MYCPKIFMRWALCRAKRHITSCNAKASNTILMSWGCQQMQTNMQSELLTGSWLSDSILIRAYLSMQQLLQQGFTTYRMPMSIFVRMTTVVVSVTPRSGKLYTKETDPNGCF